MATDAVDPALPVVVLGAGPAGLACAQWVASLGRAVVVLEARGRAGGQLRDIPGAMDNVPGSPLVRGDDLSETLLAQALRAGAEVRFEHRASLDPYLLRVRCEAQALTLDASAVVIATGVRRRRLNVPGEDRFEGRGLFRNIGRCEEELSGRDVVVLGGGDDACEHAVLAARAGARVVLAVRGDTLRARRSLQEALAAAPGVQRRFGARAVALEGDARVRGVVLATSEGAKDLVPADVVFACLGPEPALEGIGGATNREGYLAVDRLARTPRPGVWAVGDATAAEAPTVASAWGQGVTAAKDLCAVLEGRGAAAAVPARDSLRVQGLTFPARIGVYPREKQRRQTLVFDLTFDVDAALAAPTDLLGRTIDYATAAEVIREALGARHYNLIESVAETVAGILLARFAATAVTVRVTKPGVPQRNASASVEVHRRRP